jgi:hypothetical protein
LEKGYLPPFIPALKGIKFLFAACKKGLDTACKMEKIRENQRVLKVKGLVTRCHSF